MRSLVGVYAKGASAFCKVNWEEPFEAPFFDVVEGFLDGKRGFCWVKGKGRDSKIISVE